MATSGGISSGPTPWWQTAGQGGNLANLNSSAPPGYQYDAVQMKYVPTVGSATTQLADKTRSQGIQDKLLSSISGIGGSGSTGLGASFGGGPTPMIPSPGMSPSGVSTGGGVGGYGGGVSTPGTGGVGSTGGVAPIAPMDTSAAQSANFGRAKDQVGQTLTGALTGLRSSLGGRGMLGSGAESRGTAGVINTGQGQLGDVSREQAVTKSNLDQDTAKTNFSGDITQRGQTLNAQTAANSLAAETAMGGFQGQIAQRGQDMTYQTASNALAQSKNLSLLAVLKAATGGLY